MKIRLFARSKNGKIIFVLSSIVVVSLLLTFTAPTSSLTMSSFNAARSTARGLNVASWNIAAINNNPFEYWLTLKDPAYKKLMEDLEAFIEEPGARDVTVGEVFKER